MSLSKSDYNLLTALIATIVFLVALQTLTTKRQKADGTGTGTGKRNARAALIMFGGLPILAYLLGSVAYRFNQPVAVARAAFVYIAVLLPASLYVLFIASRRESLFNSYVANLDRLGLLRKRQLRLSNGTQRHYIVEDDRRLTRRVKSYLDRFSAVYGTLPSQTVDGLLNAVRGDEQVQPINSDSVTGELFSSLEIKTVLPVFGASALIALGWVMVLPPIPPVDPSPAFSSLETNYHRAWYLWAAEPVLVPSAFAFLGAYFFSIQMLLKRFMRRDLGPNAYNAVSVRILLATLGVWVTCQLYEPQPNATNHGGLFLLSFAVGAFPLIVWQLVANVLKKLPFATLALPNLEGTKPLAEIDGLSVWHEARLDEEDIENVPNLVTADIVDLILNTKISPNRIIDWVDQAILIISLPPKSDGNADGSICSILEKYGIRTASGLVAATHPAADGGKSIIDGFPPESRDQAISIASAVQLYPNYPLVQNWLSTEPCFPTDPKDGDVIAYPNQSAETVALPAAQAA